MKVVKVEGINTRTGKPYSGVKVEMSESEYARRSEDSEGVCVACGAEAYEVEPDARHYPCEACGERKVYGLEECLLLGRVVLK